MEGSIAEGWSYGEIMEKGIHVDSEQFGFL